MCEGNCESTGKCCSDVAGGDDEGVVVMLMVVMRLGKNNMAKLYRT